MRKKQVKMFGIGGGIFFAAAFIAIFMILHQRKQKHLLLEPDRSTPGNRSRQQLKEEIAIMEEADNRVFPL